MKIRKAKKKDFRAYCKLEQGFYNHHKKYNTLLQDINPKKRDLKKEFYGLMKENQFFHLAEDKGEVVGYIYGLIKKVEENEKHWKKIGELNSIFVIKEYRKKGVSQLLTRTFIKWLKSKGIKYLESSCNLKNKQALNFHKRLKFKQQYIKFGKFL